MTKAELVETVVENINGLTKKQTEVIVNTIFDSIKDALARGDKVELRGFGSFKIRQRRSREGRNPKTGDAVELTGKYVPHFKPGKELRERVNQGLQMGL